MKKQANEKGGLTHKEGATRHERNEWRIDTLAGSTPPVLVQPDTRGTNGGLTHKAGTTRHERNEWRLDAQGGDNPTREKRVAA